MHKIEIQSNPTGGHIIIVPEGCQVFMTATRSVDEIIISIMHASDSKPVVERIKPEKQTAPVAKPVSEKTVKVSSKERVCAQDGCYLKFKPVSNASKYCPLHASKKKKLSPDEEAELNATLAEIERKENNYFAK